MVRTLHQYIRDGSKPSADYLWGQLMTVVHRPRREKLHGVDRYWRYTPQLMLDENSATKHNMSWVSWEPSANWGQLMTVVYRPRREKLHCVYKILIVNSATKLKLLRPVCKLRLADTCRLQAKRTSFAGQRGKSCVVDCVRLWPSGA